MPDPSITFLSTPEGICIQYAGRCWEPPFSDGDITLDERRAVEMVSAYLRRRATQLDFLHA